MGVSSAQTGPLRPSRPPYFWVSKSCPCSSRMASSSSHSFSASTKALHRREVHTIQSANGIFPNITMLSNSLQIKRSSSYCIAPSFEKHRYPSSHWKHKVFNGTRNFHSSTARMLPDYPNQTSAEGKHTSVGYPRKIDKEVSRYLCGPLVQQLEVPRCRSINSSNASETITLSKPWSDESEKLRLEKKFFGCFRDGSANEMLKFPTDARNSELDNIPRKGNLQSSSSQGSNRSDQINLPIHRQPYLPSSQEQTSFKGGRGHFFIKNSASQMPASPELGYEGKKNISIGSGNGHSVVYSTSTGLSSEHTSSKLVQYNGGLLGKILEERKEIDSKIDGDKATDAIQGDLTNGKSATITDDVIETYVEPMSDSKAHGVCQSDFRKRLSSIYGKVLVVDNISIAKEVVGMLTDRYRHLVHACDTEVAKIDVKQETPVDHGEIICFSIYSGPDVDFGNGMSCVWVDVLDGGGRALLAEFAPFFEDPSIKKVWHNYSFDSHVIENYGIKISGFHADTMHMARLWDSSRRTEGGYSLEALTGDHRVMSGAPLSREDKTIFGRKNVTKDGSESPEDNLIGKISMKTIFGRKKVKKDGSEGKIIAIPPVEQLQREERIPWVCYSALDSISTLKLYGSLKSKLKMMPWNLDGVCRGSMLDFYEIYWQPFGELLVKMETEGMLVDRSYLAKIEKVAIAEQQVAASRFRSWASRYCPDAKYMNVGSDAQLRQLLFGGIVNRKDPNESLPVERTFKIPNVDRVIEEGKKTPTKFRNITLCSVGVEMPTEIYTATGWPSVSGDALKTLAGKVSAECDFTDDALELHSDDDVQNETMTDEVSIAQEQTVSEDIDTSAYGTAYAAFGGGQTGREACHAIAALCEVCSIDSLISNFILPLQGSHVSGKNGRIHCSAKYQHRNWALISKETKFAGSLCFPVSCCLATDNLNILKLTADNICMNQPALEKDRYKIRQAFIAAPGNSLIVADYGQLELRILAHLANCKSMLDAFKAGGDFHSRTAMNMYPHIREAVEQKLVLLEWHPQPGEDEPPVPLLKDAFASERRKAKMLNFSIAYGKTPVGLAQDWKVSVKDAKKTVDLWYRERKEVLRWQEKRKQEAHTDNKVHTLLGRARCFPSLACATPSQRGHIERAAINTPVQGSAADVAMCAMLEISRNECLKELGWRLLLQVHDEVILEGPTESAEVAKAIVVNCMSKPFNGKNILNVDLSVDAKCAQNWYSAK
ncbi:hypothetical protein L1049_000773 [Liquidambar formosana]|uniref:DNA-directed DNA polymerase n=1 Tax=Liquidambar formosana TaxID=63359 RepID=A0AAP0N9L9_LIQFO